MATYIYELKDWPEFRWNSERLESLLAQARNHQGKLLGRMEALSRELRQEATLNTRTEEVLKSSEIEGETLDKNQVRSSIARRLGIEIGGDKVAADRHVDGVVTMILDGTEHYKAALTKERLFDWHAALFPAGRSGMQRIGVGAWRTEDDGPMRVMSGPYGREKVHFEAPSASLIEKEMPSFLDWFNGHQKGLDPVLKAGIAHLWFVTIHPFEDGNGRIGRAIADMALARSEQTKERYYSMSMQIRRDRNRYYDYLEETQKGDLDITNYLEWFLGCLDRAFAGAETLLGGILRKAKFWEGNPEASLNERQRIVIRRLLDGFEGKLTSSKWAKLAKCSQDTALRDIEALVGRGILKKDPAGGRSTSYSIVEAN